MKKIFLDSDVLLDLLLDREPFMDDIAEIIERSLSSKVKLCISPITITNIYFIIGKIQNQRKADKQINKILRIVHIEEVGQMIIDKAAHSKFKDFEDGVQNYCAEEAGHEIIITRNTKDYRESELSVLTPREYLAKIRME